MIRPGPGRPRAVAGAWRLLVDPAAGGAWNMAVDEALLASVQSGGRPALRLYAWEGAWLSLGYAQPLSADRAAACERAGVGIVRRVTGGAAVLHGADLTYAVAAPESALPGGLQETYALVSRALLRALAALGVTAEVAASAPRSAGPRAFDCFEQAAQDEICVGGRKLAGSAQRRSRGGVLQHGSVRLGDDPPAAARAAGCAGPAAASLRALGVRAADAQVRAALVAGFSAELGVVFEPAALEPAERSLAVARAHRGNPRDCASLAEPLLSRLPPAGR